METERLVNDPLYSSKAWAWQFLRRNVNYQTDYLELRGNGNRGMGKDIAKKYGMTIMIPFTEVEPYLIPFQNTLALRQISGAYNSHKPLNLRKSQIALVFDLDLPVAEQLALAKAQIAEEIQRLNVPCLPPKRKRKHEFIRYLRIIDAKQSKATSRAIAEQFIAERIYRKKDRTGDKYYVGQSLIEKDWHVAKRLMEKGYRAIAYS